MKTALGWVLFCGQLIFLVVVFGMSTAAAILLNKAGAGFTGVLLGFLIVMFSGGTIGYGLQKKYFPATSPLKT